MLMRILTKYILREHLGPFLFGIGLFAFIFLSDKLFQLTDLIVTRGVPPSQVGKMLMWILPAIFAEIAPVAWLLATLMAYSRMAQDNEIAPLRAAGQSFLVLATPALLSAVCLSLGLVWFNDQVLPRANWSFKELHFNVIQTRAAIIIQPRYFISEFDGHIFYVEDKEEPAGILHNIIVYAVNPPPRQANVILAKEGQLVFNPESRRVILKLRDGEMHEISPLDRARYRRITFKAYDLDLDVNRALARQNVTATRSFSEMTFAELSQDIVSRRETTGQDKPGLSALAPLLELHKRIAIPFACLAFGLIGFPFGILVRRGGRGIGFSLSLVFTMVYYLLLVLGRTLGEKAIISPWLSAWLPNVIIAGIGLLVMRRLVTR